MKRNHELKTTREVLMEIEAIANSASAVAKVCGRYLSEEMEGEGDLSDVIMVGCFVSDALERLTESIASLARDKYIGIHLDSTSEKTKRDGD